MDYTLAEKFLKKDKSERQSMAIDGRKKKLSDLKTNDVSG